MGNRYDHDFMRAPVVLHAISSFNDTTLDQTATAVMLGLSLAIAESGPLRSDVTVQQINYSHGLEFRSL